MENEATRWVWERCNESGAALIVLLALARTSDANGCCEPSVNTLARMCHCTARWVQQQLTGLAERGVIWIGRCEGSSNRYGSTNAYWLSDYRESIGLPRRPEHRAHANLGASPEVIEQHFTPEPSFTPELSFTPEHVFTPEARVSIEPRAGKIRNININTNTRETHTGGEFSARARAGCSASLCVGASADELAAFKWAQQHDFWRTRITSLASLRRNIEPGKAFALQYAAATTIPTSTDTPGKTSHENSTATRTVRNIENPLEQYRRLSAEAKKLRAIRNGGADIRPVYDAIPGTVEQVHDDD